MRRRKMTLLPPSRDPWPALLGEEDLKLKRQYEARGGDFSRARNWTWAEGTRAAWGEL